MNIHGETRLILHVGYPTGAFKSPMIYNPYFAEQGLDALVVPVGLRPEDFSIGFLALTRVTNFLGALITMPHKVSVVEMLDEVTIAVKIAGSCNAVKRGGDGKLIGDMFDGEGFSRGLLNKGIRIGGASALIIGCGGVGSAIAASLAAHGCQRIGLFDPIEANQQGLANRLGQHYPALAIQTGSNAPEGFGIIVNASPLGMKHGDPMPLDVSRLTPNQFVGEVVMKQEMTSFLEAARGKGCQFQIGLDMLFEQIPAYLEFFGLPTTSAAHLRALARIRY